jgi:Flp pilus assembly protein TadD
MTSPDQSAATARTVQAGLEHIQAGRMSEAEAVFRRLVAHAPQSAEMHKHLGVALAGQGKLEAALANFLAALEIDPRYADGHISVGNVFIMQGRPEDAVACYRRALELSPDDSKAYGNLGIALHRTGRLEEAGVCLRRALRLNPRFADACNSLGSVLQDLGRQDEAEALFQKALQLKPGFALAQCNLATVQLLRGDLTAGLALYENRFAGADHKLAALAREVLAKLPGKRSWRGESLQGKMLFLWREQGIGDDIMMMRYLPLFKETGVENIIVSCRPEVKRLMRTLPAVGRVIDDRAPFPLDAIDCHCPLMSLPYLFGTRLETIPNTIPYITVPPELADNWSRRVAAVEGLKVGLAWAGSKTQPKDARRSIPLERFAPLLTVPGVRFISLQKGEDPRRLHECDDSIIDWMMHCDDFLDTAALVQQLDLVISVDTAVAHLAGALGRPVWLLNRFESEWRWMLEREDSPWYPTMRIFRQPTYDDWESVLDRAAAELRKRVTVDRQDRGAPEKF